ncbi:redoxin domain-containing protein [Kocuria rhizophila]|nr:redoxin domain-containing protein [Kocuria rhizophila]
MDPRHKLSLTNRDGEIRTLAQFRGAPVVLVFFPFAFSPICTDELCHLQPRRARSRSSVPRCCACRRQPPAVFDAFARQELLRLEMLSDHWPHGEVARRYGVSTAGGGRRRHTITVELQGVVPGRQCSGHDRVPLVGAVTHRPRDHEMPARVLRAGYRHARGPGPVPGPPCPGRRAGLRPSTSCSWGRGSPSSRGRVAPSSGIPDYRGPMRNPATP